MLRKLVLVAATAMAVPAGLSAQSVGIAARAGTLGLGGEVAIGLSNMLQVRGGAGVIPLEFDGEYSDLDYTIKPTSPMANIGVDFFPGGGNFRIGGGLLFLSEDTELTGEYTGTVQVGNNTYDGDDIGTLTGALDHGSMAPYAVIGFGRGTGRGFGFFIDVGAAFLEEATLTLDADGPLAQNTGAAGAEFRANLERERAEANEDAKDYLKILPIISIGFRIGIM